MGAEARMGARATSTAVTTAVTDRVPTLSSKEKGKLR